MRDGNRTVALGLAALILGVAALIVGYQVFLRGYVETPQLFSECRPGTVLYHDAESDVTTCVPG